MVWLPTLTNFCHLMTSEPRQPSVRVPGAPVGTYLEGAMVLWLHAVRPAISYRSSAESSLMALVPELEATVFQWRFLTLKLIIADGSPLLLKRAMKCLVIILNFLRLGPPVVAPTTLRPGNPLSRPQWKTACVMEGFL